MALFHTFSIGSLAAASMRSAAPPTVDDHRHSWSLRRSLKGVGRTVRCLILRLRHPISSSSRTDTPLANRTPTVHVLFLSSNVFCTLSLRPARRGKGKREKVVYSPVKNVPKVMFSFEWWMNTSGRGGLSSGCSVGRRKCPPLM